MKRTFSQFVAVALLIVVASASAQAQRKAPTQAQLEQQIEQIQRIERTRKKTAVERNHELVLGAFKDLVNETRKSVVSIQCEDAVVAHGLIVDASGLVLTKASELFGRIECSLGSGKQLPAELLAVDDEYDVALLKVEGQGLTVAPLATEDQVSVGSIVATSGTSENPIAVGTISVAQREIRQRGFLGISFDPNAKVPTIGVVISSGAAKKAGIKVGDVIQQINGIAITEIPQVLEAIGERAPGDVIKIKLLRGENKSLAITAKLGKRPPQQNASRFNNMNRMGSELSERRSGFPVVIQHDTIIFPEQCGSPLVNTRGQVVGLNIARSGRVSSLAIPSSMIAKLVAKLKKEESKPSPAFLVAMQSRALDLQINQQQDSVAKAEKVLKAAQLALDKAKGQLAETEKKKNLLGKDPAKIEKALAGKTGTSGSKEKKPNEKNKLAEKETPNKGKPAASKEAEPKPADMPAEMGSSKSLAAKGETTQPEKKAADGKAKGVATVDFFKALGNPFMRRVVPRMMQRHESVGEKWNWEMVLKRKQTPLVDAKVLLKWKDGELELRTDKAGKVQFELTSQRLKELKFVVPRGVNATLRPIGSPRIPRRT